MARQHGEDLPALGALEPEGGIGRVGDPLEQGYGLARKLLVERLDLLVVEIDGSAGGEEQQRRGDDARRENLKLAA